MDGETRRSYNLAILAKTGALEKKVGRPALGILLVSKIGEGLLLCGWPTGGGTVEAAFSEEFTVRVRAGAGLFVSDLKGRKKVGGTLCY